MHREYHPEDMQHLRAHAFGEGPGHGHDHHHHHDEHPHHHDHRSLYVLTTILGVLIACDLAFGALGLESWRAPFGISLSLIAALVGGARIIYGALEALFAGRIGADVALAQACIAAIVLGDFFVAAEVVFIALFGECLEAITADRAMRAIHRLFRQTPRTARVRREGVETEIPVGQVVINDIVIVRPAERVPVDGPVLAGRSAVDASALTGESIPVDVGPGEPVLAGTINQFGALEVRAERVGHETTLGQVLKLVADAQNRKAPLQRAADRLARYFLPVVEVVAGLTLVIGYWLGWPDVWYRTVAVLVVACPCALILATPAAIMASLAWLARHGVVLKGGIALERLAACDTFAFDKTGTLTIGRPAVSAVVPLGVYDNTELVRFAATAEQSSRHPLAEAILRAAAELGVVAEPAFDITALPGVGVTAKARSADDSGRSILVGNRRLMTEQGVSLDASVEAALAELDANGQTPLLVAVNGVVAGLIGLRDVVRAEAHDVIHDLKHLKITEIAILTGDRAAAAKPVAKKTHIKLVEAELLPAEKAAWVEARQKAGRRVAMVGDGINDAPALARADVGIALAGSGADLAAEAGDLIILGEPLRVLPDLVKLSRETVRVIRQNIIIFAFGLNAVAMGSAALGILGPVPAAILHQVGSLLVLLNAMRLLAFGDWRASSSARRFQSIGAAIQRFDERLSPGRWIGRLSVRWRTVAGALSSLGLMVFVTWNWVAIRTGEVGLVQRQGRYLGALRPGLHLRWPPPFERVTRLQPDLMRRIEIGFRSGQADSGASAVRWESAHDREVVARAEDEALIVTGDGQLVEIAAALQYRVAADAHSLRRYAFGASNADAALRPLAESAIRSIIGRRSLDALLTGGRREAELAVANMLQQRIDDYALGLIIVGVGFQDLHPPLAVVDAYRDVSRAESENQKRINEGRTYHAERLIRADGQAAATVEAAEADRLTQVTRAAGESEAFLILQDARSAFPALSDLRLYGTALSAALAGKGKVILDPARANERRHLILPELRVGSDFSAAKAAALVGPPKP
jgi:P-type Cu+ transporter